LILIVEKNDLLCALNLLIKLKDMNTKIDGYKSLLTHITVAQNVQFHRDATGQIEPLAPQVNGIVPAFEAYKSDAVALDAEFDRKNKTLETDE
jgi:hypothetical protein